MSDILKKHCKSPFPALHATRRDKTVPIDTLYADTLAINNGCKQETQIFVGTKSMFTDVYDMKTDS